MELLDETLLQLIVCPRDKQELRPDGDWLHCSAGHRYRIIDGIPILLVSEAEQTHIEGTRALAVAKHGDATTLPQCQLGPGEIDPFVKLAIAATNGSLYQHLVGELNEYPVPALRLPDGDGRSFLDIGCNWGRWCLAAARRGYRPVGIDPSLKGICAARRVARQLGIQASYLVADGRYLPFRDSAFVLTVFSSICRNRTSAWCCRKFIVFCTTAGSVWSNSLTSSASAACITN